MELLNRIQRELKVPKSQFNAFAKYNYRNCEDILEAVKPLLGENGALILSDEVVQYGDRFYVRANASLYASGVLVGFAYGLAREALDKKGMDEAQITGAASSYARKYALCGLFAIDDGEDADKEDNSQEKAITKMLATSKPIAPKVAIQSKEAKKKAIASLLRAAVQADPNNLDAEPSTKEEYEEACVRYTDLPLIEENYDRILKALTK